MHPRLLFAVRRDLSILHAAISIDDLRSAVSNRLELLADESIPFDELSVASTTRHPTAASTIQPATGPGGEPQMCHLHVGYGWFLSFEFRDGEAHGIRLEEVPVDG